MRPYEFRLFLLPSGILSDVNDFHPNRRSVRLPGYDYGSDGGYFVTICAAEKRCIFGSIANDRVQLSPIGVIVAEEWQRGAQIRPELQLDVFVIMPNHFHAIVRIDGALPERPEAKGGLTRDPRSIASMIGQFKAAVTARVRRAYRRPTAAVWQRGFYERVIRDGRDLDQTREYILANPFNWATDPER